MIDYKQELHLNTDDEKREFLADVSSFANASGGYIVFGIEEDDGLPTSLREVRDVRVDEEILKIDHIIRDGIDPRVPRVTVAAVPLSSGVALVVRVPRSFAMPHMVKYKNLSRFYSRSSNGKYQLDVQEIRSLFALSESAGERIRRYRLERLSNIVAGETPVPMRNTAKVVLHILPTSTVDPSISFDVANLSNSATARMRPMVASGWDFLHTFDGFMCYRSTAPESMESRTYTQISRSGVIEAVETRILSPGSKGELFIPSIYMEEEVFSVTPRYLELLQELGVEPPLLIMLSLVDIRGYRMYIEREGVFERTGPAINRQDIIVPETIVESYDYGDIGKLLRPAFDIVWNAAGYPRSMNYDKQGIWHGR